MLGAGKINFISKFTSTAVAEVIRKKRGIAAVNGAAISTSQSKFGGSSASFDGTNDYLTVGYDNNNTFNIGTGDFTVEYWQRAISANDPYAHTICIAGSDGFSFSISIEAGLVYFRINTGIVGGTSLGSHGTITDTWCHFAVVRSGGVVKCYKDGSNISGDGVTNTNTFERTSSAQNFAIGVDNRAGTTASTFFGGYLDEIRISKTARYTGNFTPSTTSFINDDNTLLLIHADGTDAVTFFEDDNGVRTQRGVQAGGVTKASISTTQSKFNGTSAVFNGSNHLKVDPIALGSGDFTIEFWLYNTTLSGYKTMFDQRTGSDAAPVLYFNGTTFYYNVSGTDRITSSALSTNTWYHIAVSRSGTSTKMFVNGTQVGSTWTDSTTYISAGNTWIGSYYGGDSGIIGYMDEIRISNSARYTANFTSPTTAFTNDTNTLLLIHCDGTSATTVFRDDNGANANRQPKYIAASGNAQVDTAQSKFGGASALFDGTGDYLTVGTAVDTDLALGSNYWTVEFWARINSHTGQYNNVIGIWSDQGAGDGSVFYISTNMYDSSNKLGIQYIYGTNSNSGAVQFGSAITTGVWKHHAFVRNGNTLTVYTDGTSVGTHDMTGITFDVSGLNISSGFTTLKMTIGAMTGGGGAYNGWLDEIRISNNARYTGSFTPSSTPFVNDANTVLLIHADGSDASTAFYDDTGNRTQKGIQAFGNAQVDTAQSKFGGSSALFDGTGDYLSIANHTDFNLNNMSNFTVELWYRPAVISGYPAFIGSQQAGTANGWMVNIDPSGNISWIHGTSVLTATSTGITTNNWYHIAVVRSNTTNLTIYINGVSKYTTSSYSGSTTVSTDVLRIGAGQGISGTWDNGTYSINGHLDDVRISNTGRYTSAFTAPTAPFQNDANTVLLIHADGTDASTIFFDDNGKTPT